MSEKKHVSIGVDVEVHWNIVKSALKSGTKAPYPSPVVECLWTFLPYPSHKGKRENGNLGGSVVIVRYGFRRLTESCPFLEIVATF